MPDPFIYLIELNLVLLVLFLAYRLLFKKDRNFKTRRIYLLGILVISATLPLIPDTIRVTASRFAPMAIQLEGITVYANDPEITAGNSSSLLQVSAYVYMGILGLGILRLFLLLTGILVTARRSDKLRMHGYTIRASKRLHASSFFGYIFMHPELLQEDSLEHILRHEAVHREEWHSLDRILVEAFCLFNWINPLVWIYRREVIRNLEFLADSAVIRDGAQTSAYQLSMINQYIGSASITNQFSSQLKTRINMLNKNYKIGSSWKIALIFPLVCIAVVAISCSDKETGTEIIANEKETGTEIIANEVVVSDWTNQELFSVVEEMPLFKGKDPAMEFRMFIAQNLIYPEEAKLNGISGRIIISFIVTSEGEVVIPEKEYLAKQTGTNLDEVVVVGYRTITDEDPVPDKKYQEILKNEAIRVVTSSPNWTPGKQKGKNVNVRYTFPISFVMN